MNRQLFFVALVLFFNFQILAQNKQDFDSIFLPDEVLTLQDVPIYDGIEDFQLKLDEVKNNEGREPLGLVLCGGSARAFAHIGVLKAMEENGVKPDFIVANSMGAIIGMLYAYGFSPAKIEEIVSSINLSSYFEPLIPLKGGVISVRKYNALINDLLGTENFNLKDCPIPIILLTEDLYSKRQVWHAQGDFAKIMAGAFTIPAMIEPQKLTLSDGTVIDAVDAGAIDLGSIQIANHFSSNLIISTAFYDSKLNFNNPIVILNRTMSIGKERYAVRDIKNLKPLVIRNNVEHFSFMDFHKSEELTQAGYKTAMENIEFIKNTPHGNKDLTDVRKKTDSYADNTIRKIRQGEPLKQDENYIGIKLWPIISTADYPDWYLLDRNGFTLFAFADCSSFYGKLGASYFYPFDRFSADAYIDFKPSSSFDFAALASYTFSFNPFERSDFYASASMKLRPKAFPYWFKSFQLTSEIETDKDFATENTFSTGGIDLSFDQNKKFYFMFKPYYFMQGNKFSELSNGAGIKSSVQLNAKHIGFSESLSTRLALFNFDSNKEPLTRIFSSDFYRGTLSPSDTNFIYTNAFELYYTDMDPGITAAELFIIQQFKMGAFWDFAYDKNINNCAGLFARTSVSLLGLTSLNVEIGGGYQFEKKEPFGYFALRNRM